MEKKDWEINPENYQTNEDGSFILKKDGTPAKKRGRPVGSKSKSYAYHSETKEKQKVRRNLSRNKRELKKLETKVANKRHRVKKQKELANMLDGKTKSNVVAQTDLDLLPESTKEFIEHDQSYIAFKPHEGPQTDFLASSETDILYGGAAGGGKSYALLMDAIRYAGHKSHKALLLRRTLKELEELMDISRELYPLAYPGAVWKETKKTWEFPSGAKLFFGYLEKDGDVYQYQGKSYNWIGFDELTQLPTQFPWDYLRSRCRSTDPFLRDKCVMRATANPGGVGHDWVKAMYITPAAPNVTHWVKFVDSNGKVHKISRKFIPAKLSDNPTLAEGGEYETMLLSLGDPILVQRLLEGDWDVVEGAAFPEFDPKIHLIAPFPIPPNWERVKGIDYGYRAPSCCLWGAINPEDGTLIIYRELYEKGLTGIELGRRISEMEADEGFIISGVLDGASWNQTGTTGPTVGEELTSVQGGRHKLRRADKNRIAGKIQIHERLRLDPHFKRPKIQFFHTCANVVRQIQSIPLDPNNREDVDTKAEDHAYDALRYLVMSRPRMDDRFLRAAQFKKQRYIPVDPIFGH